MYRNKRYPCNCLCYADQIYNSFSDRNICQIAHRIFPRRCYSDPRLLYNIRQPIGVRSQQLVLYNVAECQLYCWDKSQCVPLLVAIRFVDRCEWPEHIDNKWRLGLEKDHHVRLNIQFQPDLNLIICNIDRMSRMRIRQFITISMEKPTKTSFKLTTGRSTRIATNMTAQTMTDTMYLP